MSTNTQASLKVVSKESEGGIHQIYSNQINLNWTGYDIAIVFSEARRQIDTPDTEPTLLVEHKASVSMSWAQAKGLRDALVKVVAGFEDANGELKVPPQDIKVTQT